MNILVIGGSYFLGKSFVKEVCKKHDITVLNRGNRKLDLKGVTQVVCDRSNPESLANAMQNCNKEYDAVVDFCAYKKGDIQKVAESLKLDVKQYIFISTLDVYQRGTGKVMTENDALEFRNFGGEAGDYISGKVALEEELKNICTERGIAYTSLRPAFIFGEDNYAPREQLYFTWAKKAGQIIHPVDADGVFQMVYVKDVVKAVLLVLGNEKAYNQAYNICASELMTYEKFYNALQQAVGMKLEKVEISVNDVVEKNLPLPFPLTKEESNIYDGSKLENLGIKYSDFVDSLKKTYGWWEIQIS